MEASQTLLAHPFPPSETKQVVQSKVIDTENKYRYKYQVQCWMGPSTVKSIMPLKLHEKLETVCTSSSSSGSSSVFGSEMIDRDWPHSTYSHFDRSPRSKVISCTHRKTRWAFQCSSSSLKIFQRIYIQIYWHYNRKCNLACWPSSSDGSRRSLCPGSSHWWWSSSCLWEGQWRSSPVPPGSLRAPEPSSELSSPEEGRVVDVHAPV